MSLEDRMLGRFPASRSEEETRDMQTFYDRMEISLRPALMMIERDALRFRGKVARASKKRRTR